MLGGGVSAVVKTPSFGHSPATPYCKANCRNKLTPPLLLLLLQCFTLFLIHNHVCSGTQESQAAIFNQTKERRSVGVLDLERFTERGFQNAFLPVSFAVGEDRGSATVRWCGRRPTQLNKHTLHDSD